MIAPNPALRLRSCGTPVLTDMLAIAPHAVFKIVAMAGGALKHASLGELIYLMAGDAEPMGENG
jgi:hypothetical protein